MKFWRFLAQVFGGALALLVEGAIHYEIHPINAIDTAKDALIVAFSFWPGMLVGYLSIWIQKHVAKDDAPDAPAAAALCALMWFVYLLRALTLVIGLPSLSNWTQTPVNWLVRFFEFWV
jgi:hypothetical protein